MPINGDGKYCPTDTKYCIKPSTNITYEYTPNNPSNPTSFCLTTIANSISYKVTDTSSPAQGDRNTYGLVLSLDAGNSASYPGSGTTWTDLSGLGNNGTLMNGPTYSSANGGSIVFDGANDYANMGASSTLNFGWTNLFSINSWIKTSQASGSYKIIVRKSTGGQGYVLSVDGSKATLYLVGAWAGNMIVIRSSNNINDGQWHHVTATYDGSKNASGSLVYVDGVNQSNIGQNTLTSDFLTSQAVGIADGTDGWGWYSGQISNVNIYNRVLLPAEITQNFNATKSRYGL
jgi:hypothetical protein